MAWSCNQVPFKSTFPEAEKFLLSHLENGGASFSSLGPQGKAYTLWAIKGRVDGPPQAQQSLGGTGHCWEAAPLDLWEPSGSAPG